MTTDPGQAAPRSLSGFGSAPASRLRHVLGAALCALCLCGVAGAGQECGERSATSPQAQARGLALGERLRDQLEQSGASAALVARVGLDLSEFNQHFTHMGLALRDHVRKRWLVLHLLNPCGKSDSEIVTQPLERFYEVYLHEFEALIVTPSYARQVALRKAFMNPALASQLHQPAYNLIAHPFNTRFQNSNQWILEMSAKAFDKGNTVSDRASAQDWLKRTGYEPGAVRISTFRRTGAAIFSAHVSFADHTEEERTKQIYQVITADSIVRFLAAQDPGLTLVTVR